VNPRYKNIITFCSKTFQDKAWPGIPSLTPIKINEQVIINLLKTLKNETI